MKNMLRKGVKGLFVLCIFSLVLGQLGTLAKIGDFRFYLFDAAIILYVLFGLTYFLFVKKSFVIGNSYITYLFLLLWMILTFPFTNLSFDLNFSDKLVAISYFVRFCLYLLSVFVTQNLLRTQELSLNSLLDTLYASGFVFALGGFIQLLLIPDFTTLDASLGLDPHKNRLASTFLDPNFAGGYLAFILSIAVGTDLFSFYKWNFMKRFLYIFIPTLALFLTFSRSSWAMFAVVILIYGIVKSRALLLISLVLALGVYFAVPRVQTRLSGTTDPADSAAFRLISWNNALEISSENLTLGVGFNSYRYAQKEYGFIEVGETGGNSGAGADSSLLLILATTGIVGLLLFIWPIITTLYSSVFVQNNFIVLATLSGLLVHSFFVNSLLYPPIFFLWPLLLDFDVFRKNVRI